MIDKNKISRLPSELAEFAHLFARQEVAAKTILLREGEVSNKAYFIEKGCMRLWFNNNGKDVTFQFFFEGEAVSSVESFRTNRPSLYSIESIEPCTVLKISKNNFLNIIDNSPEIKKLVDEITFERLVFYQNLFLSRIKDSPQKRYKELIKSQPKIIQRIPQHYIASYLGITPVSLSRIRNRK